MGPWCLRKRSIFQGWVQVRHTRCEKERKSAYSSQSLCILGPVITSESFVFIFKKPPLLPCQPILSTFKIHRQIIELSKKQTFCLSHLQMPTRNTVSLYCVLWGSEGLLCSASQSHICCGSLHVSCQTLAFVLSPLSGLTHDRVGSISVRSAQRVSTVDQKECQNAGSVSTMKF